MLIYPAYCPILLFYLSCNDLSLTYFITLYGFHIHLYSCILSHYLNGLEVIGSIEHLQVLILKTSFKEEMVSKTVFLFISDLNFYLSMTLIVKTLENTIKFLETITLFVSYDRMHGMVSHALLTSLKM